MRKLLSRTARNDSHPCAHWNSGLKKNWRYHHSHVLNLITKYHDDNDFDAGMVPCEKPTAAVVMAGCDDKSNMQVGNVIPVEATPRQSNHAIDLPGTKVVLCDHDLGSIANIVPSIIHLMNQSTNLGDSLYSGGPDGTEFTTVSVHDATQDPSTSMKHVAHLHQFLQYLAFEHGSGSELDFENIQSLAYMVLIECDGGPDHNLTFLYNQLALFGLFLIGGMDKLVATRGCPGLSYLNTTKWPMSLLKYWCPSLSLMLDPETLP